MKTVGFEKKQLPDGAASESSSNRERIDRNFSCQEFWNLDHVRVMGEGEGL